MIWNVEGADIETGEDRFVQIKAHTQQEAEEEASRQGLLVSGVYATRSKKPLEPYKPRPALLDQAVPPAEQEEVVFSPVAPPFEPPAVPDAPAARPAVPVTVAYQPPPAQSEGPAARAVPAYRGILFASRVAFAFAAILYALTAYLGCVLVAEIYTRLPSGLTLPDYAAHLNQYLTASNFYFLGIAGVASVLHLLSAGCVALRDIARNSFGG